MHTYNNMLHRKDCLAKKSPAALPPMDELRTARKSNISSSYALNTYKDSIWRKIAGGNAANGNMEKNRTPTNMFSISQASTTIHKSHCQRCKNLLTASGDFHLLPMCHMWICYPSSNRTVLSRFNVIHCKCYSEIHQCWWFTLGTPVNVYKCLTEIWKTCNVN